MDDFKSQDHPLEIVTNPTRILVVEDNPDDELLLLRQLEQAKLHEHVKIIRDGKEALTFLADPKSECEHLIAMFLDLQLPSMGGIQVLKKVRSIDRVSKIPVIVMTSSNTLADLDACRKLKVSRYVEKPISLATFLKAVADSFHAPVTRDNESFTHE